MVHSTRLVQSNWGFALLNFAIWYWNTFLNKCGFVIHHFNAHFSLYFVFTNFLIIICCSLYIYFRLGKGHWTKSKFEWFSYSGSKWVVKQQRQLTTSTVPLAQELLMNIQCTGASITFAKETKALKMRSAAVMDDWKLTTANWEHHQSWSPYNYTRTCLRTWCQPFYGHSVFEANWKGEKAQ